MADLNLHPAQTAPAKTLLVVAGPTAVGKTAVAIEVAQQLGTYIVSADSRQCYKEMTIGTAKPDREELQAVKHYFIDEFPLTQALSAADYEKLALTYLDEVFATHDIAVLSGGTGLYIKALCEGLDEMPQVNETIVQQTEAEYAAGGIEWLQTTVSKEDPEFYAEAEIHNPARMLRALSFIRTTGQSITHYRTQIKKQRPFRIIKVGLELPRELLYERINMRVDKMIADGLEAEVYNLLPYKQLKNLQTVGYQELFDLKDGVYTSRTEAIDKIKQHTRNYAKRQMTLFKKDKEIHWLRADDKDVAGKIIALLQM